MRKTDILLVVLFVVFVLGIAFGPELVSKWRAEQVPETTTEATAEPAADATATLPDDVVKDAVPAGPRLGPEAELERVSGMLMLHDACVDRFEDFAVASRDVVDAWKQRHAGTLAKREEQDFHIVLAQPEGSPGAASDEARAAERELCERNLAAMQSDLGTTPQP